MKNALKIHTSLSGASAILSSDETLVSAAWKQTKNQDRKERAVLLPADSFKTPEVPEAFRPLVEAVLLSTAENTLKKFVEQNPSCFEVAAGLFEKTSLTESFLASSDGWVGKQELELGFVASKTWKRITGRKEFQENTAYQAAANSFKDAILKLTGKNVSLDAEKCDAILSKMEDDDLETGWGVFVAKRLEALKSKPVSGLDFSSL